MRKFRFEVAALPALFLPGPTAPPLGSLLKKATSSRNQRTAPRECAENKICRNHNDGSDHDPRNK